MKIFKWIIVSEIFTYLSHCEKNFRWDLDCFESAKLTKSIYNSLMNLSKERLQFNFEKKYITQTIAKRMIEKAYIDCWGFTHKCKSVQKKELEFFMLYFNEVFNNILDNNKE